MIPGCPGPFEKLANSTGTAPFGTAPAMIQAASVNTSELCKASIKSWHINGYLHHWLCLQSWFKGPMVVTDMPYKNKGSCFTNMSGHSLPRWCFSVHRLSPAPALNQKKKEPKAKDCCYLTTELMFCPSFYLLVFWSSNSSSLWLLVIFIYFLYICRLEREPVTGCGVCNVEGVGKFNLLCGSMEIVHHG